MDEQEFDSLAERSRMLTVGLWGRTPDDLQRQLLAPYPEIPSGFELDDLRELLRSVERISVPLIDPRYAVQWFSSQTILVGTQSFTVWEARCEIVRRAIEYLESR